MIKSQFAQPFKILKNESLSDHFFFLEGISLWNKELNFHPGQYLMIDSIINGIYLRRSYSPFLLQNRTLGLLIQRNFDGVFSSNLNSIKKGSIIRISAPTGKNKSIPDSAENAVFFAFDNGISFALNMLTYQRVNIPVCIYWQSDSVKKTESEIIKQKFFQNELLIFHEDLKELVEVFKKDFGRNTVFYLSGNGQKISFFEEILRSLEITNNLIIKEIYFNYNIEPQPEWFDLVDNVNRK